MFELGKYECRTCRGVFGKTDFTKKLERFEELIQGGILPPTCPFCGEIRHVVLLKRIPFPITEEDMS